MSTRLSVYRLGAEVLVEHAQKRSDGVLTCNGIHVFLRAGRPESAARDELAASTERNAVVSTVRELALMSEGEVLFRPEAVAASGLSLDTMGEVLMAMGTKASPALLSAVFSARAKSSVHTTPSFARLAKVVAGLGVSLAEPSAGVSLAALVADKSPNEQRMILALSCLGGLRLVSPAQALIDEVRAMHAKMSEQTHYEVLGLAKSATVDDVRKAYLNLAKRWHSDSFVGHDLEDAAPLVEAIFARLGDAQRVLCDTKEREAYDIVLTRKAQGLPTDAAAVMRAEMLFQRAQGLVRRGQAAAALPLLEEAVALNQTEPEFWAYLGFALYNAHGHDSVATAREHLKKAQSLRQNMDVAHEFLGRIAHVEGDYAAAASELRRAVELNPKNVDAERELRLIHMRKGKAPEPSSIGELFGKLLKKK